MRTLSLMIDAIGLGVSLAAIGFLLTLVVFGGGSLIAWIISAPFRLVGAIYAELKRDYREWKAETAQFKKLGYLPTPGGSIPPVAGGLRRY